VHLGTNGHWHEELTEKDSRWYEETARIELGDACAHWLATGK
jgi:aryl sulfotransferase